MDNRKELIERLRTESLYKDKATLEIMDLCMEAADTIAALTEENARLRVAGEQDRVLDELHAEVNYMQSYNADAEKVIENLCTQLEQVKRERDAAVELLESVVRHGTNPCEGCKADCIDAGSDDAEYTSQCGMFAWCGPQKEE